MKLFLRRDDLDRCCHKISKNSMYSAVTAAKLFMRRIGLGLTMGRGAEMSASSAATAAILDPAASEIEGQQRRSRDEENGESSLVELTPASNDDRTNSRSVNIRHYSRQESPPIGG